MTTVETAVAIKASPAQVLAVVLDVERWPEWTPTVMSAKRLESGPFVPGSRTLMRQPKLPPAVWQVSALEAQRGFAWMTSGPGTRIIAEHWVEADESGSRVVLSLRYSGVLAPLVSRFGRSLSERYLAIEARSLRERCEALARG